MHWDSSFGIRYLVAILTVVIGPLLGVNANARYGRKTVITSFGSIRGETFSPDVDDLPAVTQYLGVPYGMSPAGQHRYGMAISAAKWTHQPKDAFRLSPVCVQPGIPHLSETEALKSMSAQRFDHLHKILPSLKPQSEDCLYLNLYVPERLERNKDNTNGQLSVLVVVHGSDYGWGAGNPYNASILAAYGQVVVVTLNYRLGVYGFLGRCESSSCTGNAALSDLVAALKMLSNILPSFGADPASLTLMGWGSGASLISLLMASPITQPKNRLFRRAILLDGTALSPWAMASGSETATFLNLAEELKCFDAKKPKDGRSRTEIFQRQSAQILRCIQEHSQHNLTAAARKVHAPTFLSAFGPVVDGQIVPNHPKYSFAPQFGALFREIDLMIGTVSHPAHHLMANADLEHGVDKERRDKILRTLVRNLYDYHRAQIFDAILSEYTDWENPKNHPKTIRNGVLAALGDALFTAPLVETARMHSTDDTPKVANTYSFVFAHETKAWVREQPSSGIRGSLSDDHVPYILGYPLSVEAKDNLLYSGFNSDDKGISRVMMHYVSNFVKSGDPSKPFPMPTETTIEDRFHSTPWPQFSQATREAYLEISDRPRVKNYYRNSYVGFWTSYLPKLNHGSNEVKVPEEHNFLPDHFNKHSFYGVVRPYSSFHNDPFPPPPLPPTPFPKDLLKKPSSTVVPKEPEKPTADAKADARSAETTYYSNMLVITVAVGVGFLVLNIILMFSVSKSCVERNRKSKKQLKYQSYTTNHPINSDVNYIPNSPLNQQLLPPPPPPITSTASAGLTLSDTHSTVSRINLQQRANSSTLESANVRQAFQHQMAMNNGDLSSAAALRTGSLQEQEPLLAASSKSSTPAGVIRPGGPAISPTCPRHGRAAQIAMLAASRANSIGSGGLGTFSTVTSGPTLEEVQV